MKKKNKDSQWLKTIKNFATADDEVSAGESEEMTIAWKKLIILRFVAVQQLWLKQIR